MSLAAGEILQHFMLLLYLAVLPVVLYTSLSLHSVCVGAERGRSSLLHCLGLTEFMDLMFLSKRALIDILVSSELNIYQPCSFHSNKLPLAPKKGML